MEVANDWYVRNVNPTVRAVPVAAGTTVYELDAGYVGFLTVPYPDCPMDPAGLSPWDLFWVLVNGGETTEILEQFTPQRSPSGGTGWTNLSTRVLRESFWGTIPGIVASYEYSTGLLGLDRCPDVPLCLPLFLLC